MGNTAMHLYQVDGQACNIARRHGHSERCRTFFNANAITSKRSSKIGKPEVVKKHDAWQLEDNVVAETQLWNQEIALKARSSKADHGSNPYKR